jgi:hypothetical protein
MNEVPRLPKYGLSIGRSPAAAHDPSPALQLRRVVAVQTFSVVAEAVVDLYLDEADLAKFSSMSES